MAWLAKLDARSETWTWPTRGVYLTVKWSLIALGAFALIRLNLDRLGIWSLYP